MKPIKVYICGTAYGWEIKETDVTCYPSMKALKRNHSCTNECGIVELTIGSVKWKQKPKPITKWKTKALAKLEGKFK